MASLRNPAPRTVEGRAATFATYHRQYRGAVCRLAQRLTRDGETAQDVEQETFLYLWSRLGADAGQPLRDPKRLLERVVRSLCRDTGRKVRRRPHVELTSEVEDSLAQTEGGSWVDREWLVALLSRLDAPERCVVLRRYIEGLSVPETARALGVKDGTVWSRLSRALSKLRSFEWSQPGHKRKPESRKGRPSPNA